MADNYLERQYEKYQERKAAWEKQRKWKRKPVVKPSVTPQPDPVKREETPSPDNG